MSSAKVARMYPEYASAQSNSTKPSVVATDSMITSDRSRAGMGTVSMISTSFVKLEAPLMLAGPMQDWDCLYLVCVLFTLLNTMVAGVAVFLPSWFTFYVKLYDKQSTFGLFDSTKCPKFDALKCAGPNVCFGGCFLGGWVQSVQIMGVSGLVFSGLSLFIQAINLCLKFRRRLLHMLSLYLMAGSAVLLMAAGHLVHYYSVWRPVMIVDDKYMRVNPMGGGLMLVCTVLASWICVLTHVSSHAPGPLSVHTRFAHTYDRTMKPSMTTMLLTPSELAPEPPPQTSMLDDFRKASIHSTAV